jgi:hypothetical protein
MNTKQIRTTENTNTTRKKTQVEKKKHKRKKYFSPDDLG